MHILQNMILIIIDMMTSRSGAIGLTVVLCFVPLTTYSDHFPIYIHYTKTMH